MGAVISEMLAVWDTIEKTAREQHPHATEEEIYQLVAGAMRAQLGLG